MLIADKPGAGSSCVGNRYPLQALAYLTPVEYVERELAKTHSPVLLMYSAMTMFY